MGKLALAAAAAGAVAVVIRALLEGEGPIVILLAAGAAFSATYLGAALWARIATRDELNIVRRKIAAVMPGLGITTGLVDR